MANEYAVNKADLKAVADAIRTKGGTSDALEFPDGFVDAVEGIQAGSGGDSSAKALVHNTLKSYSDEELTEVRPYVFYGASNLESVYLPNVTFLNDYAFPYSGLKEIELPSLTSMWKSPFTSCKALKYADVNRASALSSSAFYGTSLKFLILRYPDGVVTNQNSNVFGSSPFATNGTGGWCFVPSALISSYQSATNWSTIYAAGTCVFLPIEEYTLDGTITGKINREKLNALEASE